MASGESASALRPDLVTGAFGNTGSRIARLLTDHDRPVRTLTSRAPDQPTPIERFGFDDLAAAFDGVATFYNTFWMRTGDPGSHGRSYAQALERSLALVDAATAAGVERIVHLSVAKADAPEAAQYPYFAAKAQVEAAIRATGIPHTIVRPALIFGGGPGLLEQLARVLRRAPVMGIAGDGRYRVRPVHVDDVARLCESGIDGTVDAVGPDRPTFDELVRAVAAAIGRRARLVHLPTAVVLGAGRAIGKLLGDELLTRDELESTVAGIADTDGPATGSISLMTWLTEHGHTLVDGD